MEKAESCKAERKGTFTPGSRSWGGTDSQGPPLFWPMLLRSRSRWDAPSTTQEQLARERRREGGPAPAACEVTCQDQGLTRAPPRPLPERSSLYPAGPRWSPALSHPPSRTALRALLRLDWPRRAPAHRCRGTWPLGRITRSTSLLRDSWCLQALRGMAAPGGHSPGGSSDGHRGRPGRGLSAVQSDAPLQGSGCPSPCHPCGVLGFLLPLSRGAGTVLEASWPGVAPGVSLTARSHHVSIFHFYEHLFVL